MRMVPRVVAHPGARPTGRMHTVDTRESRAPAHPPTEDHDHRAERPHACIDGWVTLGQIVIDPETGEETEEFALYPCRRYSGDESR